MPVVVFQDVMGREVRPPVTLPNLPPSRRRLSALLKRYEPKGRPYVVSLHRSGDVLRPEDHTVRCRRRSANYVGKTWSETVVRKNGVVLVTCLPLGGGGSSGSSSGKQIGMAVGLIALTLAAPYALAAIAPELFGTATALTFAGKAAVAGLVVGGGFLASKFLSPAANQDDTTPLYSATGGGNLPRPGDRIPSRFGTSWFQPDQTQPDFTIYNGEDILLFKRHTLGLGKYQVHQIGIGTSLFWDEDGGVRAPFNFAPGGDDTGQLGQGTGGGLSGTGGGCEVEIVNPGGLSTLVPASVYSNPDVAGTELPRVLDNPSFSGPFRVSPVGKPTATIQLDFSLPGGVSAQDNPASWGVIFLIAPCDDDGNPTTAFTTLHEEGGVLHSTRGLRYTRYKSVPSGNYVVTATNTIIPADGVTNAVNWDGLRSYFPEVITRPHVTEIALKIRSGKNLGITAFGDVWVKATRIVRVWDYDANAFVEQPSRKCVWSYLDIMTSQYGGAFDDDKIDIERLKFYDQGLDEFDTCDGTITGPISVFSAASTVLGTMRAEPTRIGNVWSLSRDEPTDVRRHHITRRQIIRDSTSSTFKTACDDGSADVIAEFSPDGDPRRRRDFRITFGEETLIPSRLNIFGVSEWDHANHIATWKAARAYYGREQIQLTMDRRGRIIRRGQTANIDGWFLTDVVAVGIMDFDDLTLTLDTDVTVDDATYIDIRGLDGLEWGPVKITAGDRDNVVELDADDVAAIETSTGILLSDVIIVDEHREMTSATIGALVDTRTGYIIDSAVPQSDDRVSITAMIDSDAVWTALGIDPTPEPPIPSVGDMVDPPSADVPWVSASCIQKGVALEMDWAVGSARGASAYVINISYDGETWEEAANGLSTSGAYTLRGGDGVTVKVSAWAVSKTGLTGNPVYTTFETFKPSINSDTSSLLVDVEALTDDIKATLAQVQPVVDEAAALLDKQTKIIQALDPLGPLSPESTSSVDKAAIAAVVPNIYAKSDSALRAAMLALKQATELRDRISEAGLGTHTEDGRWSIEGVGIIQQGLRDLQSSVSITVDLTNAQIALKADTNYVNDVAAAIIQGSIPAYRWEFNGTAEGWTTSGCTIAQNAGSITVTATGPTSYIQSPTLTLDADANKIVNVQVRRLSGTDWGLALNYGPSYSIQRSIPVPTAPASWSLAGLDQNSDATWTGSVTGIRISFGGTTGDSFEIDFIELGSFRVQDLLLSGVEARLADAEVLIDGLTGSITEKANQTTVASLTATINDVVASLDAATDAIALSASQTTVDALDTRLTSAEVTISGALSQITEAVQTSGLLEAQAAGKAALQALLEVWRLKDVHAELVANVNRDMQTYVDDLGGFVAVTRDSLQTQVLENVASILDEKQARSDAVSAEASARSLLAVEVHDPVSGLAAVKASVDHTTNVLGTATSGQITDAITAAVAVLDPSTGLAVVRASANHVTSVLGTATSGQVSDAITAAVAVLDPTTGLTATAASANHAITVLGTATSSNITDAVTAAAAVLNPSTGLSSKASASDVTTIQLDLDPTHTNSLAQRFATLSSAVNDGTTGLSTRASASDMTSVQTSLDPAHVGSFAYRLASVETQSNGNDGSIGLLLTSTNGGNVVGGIIGTINGVTGGFVVNGVLSPDRTVSYTLEVSGNLVVNGSITGAKIAGTTITAGNIAVGTITFNEIAGTTIKTTNLSADSAVYNRNYSGSSSTNAYFNAPSISVPVINVTVPIARGNLMINASLAGLLGDGTFNAQAGDAVIAGIYVDGSLIKQIAGLVAPAIGSFPFGDNVVIVNSGMSIGNHTVEVRVSVTPNGIPVGNPRRNLDITAATLCVFEPRT